MNKVRLNEIGIVTDVNCNGASIPAPDYVACGWQRTSTNPDVWTNPNAAAEQQAENYKAALESGYTDEVTGVKLKTTHKAQRDFTSLVTMIQEGLSLGAITNDTPQTIWNYSDEPVVLTTLQVRQLLFRYGLHCKAFFDDYAP